MATTFYKIILIVLIGLVPSFTHAQGQIEHIKRQPYLAYAENVNCDSVVEDQLTSRICANLQFQKSDSLFTVVYKRLIEQAKCSRSKTRLDSIIYLQHNWRRLRDQHCAIVYNSFGEKAGSEQTISYLHCLTEMTNSRTKELEQLYSLLE